MDTSYNPKKLDVSHIRIVPGLQYSCIFQDYVLSCNTLSRIDIVSYDVFPGMMYPPVASIPGFI